MTSLIRVFDADTIFLITIHAFLTSIPTQYFTHQISLASANDSLKTDFFLFILQNIAYKKVLLSWLWVYVHLISFPFPTLYDETTQKDKHMS